MSDDTNVETFPQQQATERKGRPTIAEIMDSTASVQEKFNLLVHRCRQVIHPDTPPGRCVPRNINPRFWGSGIQATTRDRPLRRSTAWNFR